MFNKVAKAITVLHKNGLVFRDLQLPKIIVSEEWEQLVDFDWCAKDRVGIYPVNLNDVDQDIRWHPSVKRGGVMCKEHNIFMLQKLHVT